MMLPSMESFSVGSPEQAAGEFLRTWPPQTRTPEAEPPFFSDGLWLDRINSLQRW